MAMLGLTFLPLLVVNASRCFTWPFLCGHLFLQQPVLILERKYDLAGLGV